MKIVIIIPARMASKRFPDKPLALINGIPMIQRVWEKAIKSNLGDTYVACSEKEVFDLITNLGGTAIMTDPKLPSVMLLSSSPVHTPRLYVQLFHIIEFEIVTFSITSSTLPNIIGDSPILFTIVS